MEQGNGAPCNACETVEDKPTGWEADGYNDVFAPKHYNFGKYECIDVMRDNFGTKTTEHFCLLNAFYHVCSAKHKNGVNAVKKAIWYLTKYLELEGEPPF